MRKVHGPEPDFSVVRGRHVLIALSGGCDSVALAELLAARREDFALTLSAAHMDHAIRPDSAADADFCRALCERLGIAFHTARIEVPRNAALSREGVETAARRIRYAWLREVMASISADCIALAHHMDDQAETVLMHLARGTGPDGIAGMREMSGDLYRPLLGYRKRKLEEYLRERGIAWREDSTNALDDTPRNALRLHGIPALEKSYPQFVSAAARYAQSAEIESAFLAQLTDAHLKTHLTTGPYGAALDLEPETPRAILRRALRAACPDALDWDRLNALEALCFSARGRLDLSAGHFAERAGSRLYFVPKRTVKPGPVDLAMDGRTCLPGICEITTSPTPPEPVRDDPMCQVLNAASLSGAVLRTRRDGDRIRPLGCGDKLLSDYLTDKKIDRPLRDSIAVAAVGGRVLWVCGLGIAQEAAVDRRTQRAVRLECRYLYGAMFDKR